MKLMASLTILATTFWAGYSTVSGADQTFKPRLLGVYEDAFLEEWAGGKIIHVKGEPYEVGVQYGYLLADDLNQLFPMLREKVCEMYDYPAFVFDLIRDLIVTAHSPYFPADIISELTGIYDGARERLGEDPYFTLDDLIMANSLVDALATFNLESPACCGFAAWGPLTEGGKLFSTRNIDLFTGLGLENYTLITILKETGKTPIANIGFVGLIGSIAGMSSQAMSFAQIWGYSTDMDFGTPWPLNARKILQTADDVDDAVRIFQETNRTYGSNFVFSDGRNLAGVTIETTANLIAHFYDDDPNEDEALWHGECYAVRMPNAVFRGAIALDPQIRAHQYEAVNGPDGDPRETDSYKVRYKGQADRIRNYQNAGRPIGVDEAMTISQEVAIRGESMMCVVYANTDLDFYAAYSYIDEDGNVYDAWEMPYNYVPFDSYLPTITTDLNQTRFRPGDRLRYVLGTTNFGHEHHVYLYLALVIENEYYFYPNFSSTAAAMPLDLESDEPPLERIEMTVPISFEVPVGNYAWLAVLIDPETGGLIDIDRRDFMVWH